MFGRPPGSLGSIVSPPPDRGSFPLDHDGECKNAMTKYMQCLRSNKSQTEACRPLSKDYLECRMAKGLMERDTWENLGLSDVKGTQESTSVTTASPTTSDKS